jgi:hypothetical protein
MTIQAKLILAAVIAVIIGGLGWFSYHMVHVWANQKTTNAEQSVVIKDQGKTIQLDASSAQITDQATANAAQIPQQVQDTQAKIDVSTEAQIKDIAQKYAGQTITTQVTYVPPVTPANPKPVPVTTTKTVEATAPSQPTPYEVEVSQARINGVWQTYCAGNPSDPDCSTPAQQ